MSPPKTAHNFSVSTMKITGKITHKSILLALLCFLTSAIVHAQTPIDLYNTGMSTTWYSSAPVAFSNGTTDTHWTILSMPGGSPADAITALNHPAWLANSSTSQWINDTGDGNNNSPFGDYTYRTTFALAGGTNLNAVTLSFQIAVDNSLVRINLNGVNTGLSSAASFNAWSSPMSITTGFQTGTNTLDFVINNASTGANPQGLRVEFLSAVIIPEPSPLALLTLGGLVLRKRRRQTFSSRA